MAEKYFHTILGSDTLGNGTAASPYQTYAKARAIAGTDEVYGGGIGTNTWATIRFLSSDGDDANSGLTPDVPKKTIATFWNANDISASNLSMVFLAKGNYALAGENWTLSKGGKRTNAGVGSTKMLRGYAGDDYFGTGKVNVTYASGKILLDTCDNTSFKNILGYDLTSVGTSPMFSTTGGNSYFQRYEDIDALNCSDTPFDVASTPFLKDVHFIRCNLSGRAAAKPGKGLSLQESFDVSDCYIENFVAGVRLGSTTYGAGLHNVILNNCTNGIEAPYTPRLIFDGLVFNNCGSALEGLGFSSSNGLLTVINSIFRNVTKLYTADFAHLLLRNCCFSTVGTTSIRLADGVFDATDKSSIGEGCFVADPQFVDPDHGDFRLRPTSPCINMGLTNPRLIRHASTLGAWSPRCPVEAAVGGSRGRQVILTGIPQELLGL